MADAPKKRPWFQYHLSTLIVLQFVAAGLLWLNMRQNSGIITSFSSISYLQMDYGWPRQALVIEEDGPGHGILSPEVPKNPRYHWNFGNVTIDLICGLAVCALVALACEWRIRRSERKP